MQSRDISLEFFPKSYVVLDIETTGFSPQNNEIIELSALKIVNGEINDKFSKLVKPSGYVSSYITQLTGITPLMLKNADDITKVIIEFKDFCSDNILVGHNITFDLSFINRNLLFYYDKKLLNNYIDTLVIARKLLPNLPSKKLEAIAVHFKLNTEGMHRGLKDCMVTNFCYKKFMEMQPDLSIRNATLFDIQKM